MGFHYGFMTSPIQNATITIGPLECSNLIPPTCEEYEVLDDPTRKSSYESNRKALKRDVYNRNSDRAKDWKGSNWYRILAGAGSSLASSLVNEYHCGTHAAGFIKYGEHPSIIGSKNKATVCFNANGNECFGQLNIEIKNCGHYYLYNLPDAPGSHYGYCTQ